MKEKINEKKSLLREAEKIKQETGFNPKREMKVHRHGSGFFGGILTKIIIILFLLIVLLFGGYYVFTKKFAPKKEVNVAIVMSQLSLCQELVTAKNRYSDIVSVNKSKFLGKSFAIVKFTGIIRMGIPDITKSDIEVYNEGKSLRIRIPDVEVLGNEIESQEVFDEAHNIFIPITLDEVFTELEKKKNDTLEDLIDEGILNDARENAKKVIQQIMMAAGFEEVIVV
ncbi:MAG: DUF4230 domain-containing protein [Treponema sp.]|nr:DUF4230 domain-containing protein [Treponema sp.]